MHEILTPKSSRWEEFAIALEVALSQANGCDSHEPENAPENVHRHAKSVLSLMEGVNISETIEFFKANGCYCDCEILEKLDPFFLGQ
jgi:hypothetical protein